MSPPAVPLLLLLFLLLPGRPRRFAAGAAVGGAVYYDVNGNGARDADEPGVGNAEVLVRTCRNGRRGDVRTDSEGTFSMDLEEPGCYFIRFDLTQYNFTEKGVGSDVDPVTGRTDGVTIDEGEAAFWNVGLVPPPGSGIAASPADPPTASPATAAPSTSPPTAGPSPVPSTRPSEGPSSGEPTAAPTVSRPPSGYPTATVPPTACVVRDVVGDSILSSAPIQRASFGTVFSLSTPPAVKVDGKESLFGGGGGGGDDGNATDGREDWGEESIKITSLSLRVLTPLLSQVTDTDYQVWYRPGDYRPGPNSTTTVDGRGNFDEWTLIARGNSLGTPAPDEESAEVDASATYQEPLLLDSNFLSGAYPSDAGSYPVAASTLSTDGGMDTQNWEGARIKTYLYRIPRSVFRPVSIAKHGGKASFYVTLGRAALQYGDAGADEWDVVDVENGAYDPSDEGDMNVRIHVGEGVTSKVWSTSSIIYQPRRFLGKVWYEHTTNVPCGMHVGAPSEAPSDFRVPPPPGVDAYTGKAINTTFVLSVFMQQGINEARRMDDEVIDAFRPTVVGFLNEEWVMGHCLWGTALDVEYQRLSLLELDGARRRLLLGRRLRGGAPNGWRDPSPFLNPNGRQLQRDITVLQVEMFIEGVAFDDSRACPASAVPATPTTRGENWDDTMSQIGIDFILENVDELQERLQEAHPYFDDVFTLSADPNLLERSKDTPTEILETEPTNEGNSLLIPIVAAACGGAALLCLLGIFYYVRKRKRRQKDDEGEQRRDEAGPSNVVVGFPQKEDSVSENIEKEVAPEPVEEREEREERGYDPDDFVEEVEEEEEELPEPPKPVIPVVGDPLKHASPSLRKVPQLEEIIMLRGLPRRRSEPNMVTGPVRPLAFARTRSLSCLREVWINLNKPSSKNNPDLAGGYLDQLLDGTLYPVDDHDVLYWERERYIRSEDTLAPYVPHGGSIEHNFIDESEAMRVESPQARSAIGEVLSDDAFGDREEAAEGVAAAKPMFKVKQNPLVMQQVEMLEAKWKQLREEYDEDGEYDEDENNLDQFDVNDRIEQLMGHIEKLELERKMRLASLKQQEEEEDELARKRMVRAGMGINYEEELSRDFVIRKKKKSSKSKKAVEDLDVDDISEESSSEEEEEDADFDVKWMRLKVPLAAQDPGAMRSLVNKGRDMDE